MQWLLFLLAMSWTTLGELISTLDDVCSVGNTENRFTSDVLGLSSEPTLEVNNTHLELRDAMVIPWSGPLPLFAQFPSQHLQNQAYIGWGEIFILARIAMSSVCQRTSSFYRYFSEEHARDVFNVFSYILGRHGYGPDEVTQPDWPLSILYGSQRSIWDRVDNCVTKPDFTCWFSNWGRYPTGGPYMVLCPQLFPRFPRPLFDWDCDHVPEAATGEILTVGTLMLHEITHWNILTLKAAPEIPLRVVDYGYELGGVRASNDGMPPDGYGPYNAMMLNRNRGRGQGASKQPYQNADNFMLFALESYFLDKCKREFKDPPDPNAPQAPRDAIENLDNTPGNPHPFNPQAPEFSPMPSVSSSSMNPAAQPFQPSSAA